MKSMFDAIEKNDIATLRMLIYQEKKNINEKYLDETPFLFASKVSDLKTLIWLAQNGADIFIENKDYTALHYVIFGHRGNHQQQHEKITYLLAQKFTYDSPEFAHVVDNNIEFFKDALKTSDLRDIKDRFGAGILHYAAALNKLDIVKLIIESRKKSGIPIDEKDKDGNTPFLVSAGSGHIDVMKYFLKNGASIKEKNNHGETALLKATKTGHLDAVKWLLSSKGLFGQKGGGASIKEKDNYERTALLIAADNGYTSLVEYLLKKGASVKEKDKNLNSPGIKASRHGHIDTLKVLIKNGTSIKETDSLGSTLLLNAASFGQLDMVKWLLKEGGASIDEKDNDGNTALLKATLLGELETVKWILKEGGASILEKDKYGTTVLSNAVCSGNLKIVRWLIEEAGASISEKNKYGITSLMEAVKEERIDVVRWLLNNGASVIDKDGLGKTVFEMAIEKNNPALIQILIEEGLKTDTKLVVMLLDALQKGDFDSIKELTKTAVLQENVKSKSLDTEDEFCSQRKSVSSQPSLLFSNGKQEKNVSQNEEVYSSNGLRKI